jgi:hypothetical protein
LILLLCLTASLATLRGRITAFLKERLISSGEGKVLPAVAARKLNISGHGSPRGRLYSPICILQLRFLFELEKLTPDCDFILIALSSLTTFRAIALRATRHRSPSREPDILEADACSRSSIRVGLHSPHPGG